MFCKSTYQENLTASEATKEMPLEEVTWSWGQLSKGEERAWGAGGGTWLSHRAGDREGGRTAAPPP